MDPDAPTPPGGLAHAPTPPHGTALPEAARPAGRSAGAADGDRPATGTAAPPAPGEVAGRPARRPGRSADASGTGAHRVPAPGAATGRTSGPAADVPTGRTGSHRVPRPADAAGTGSQRPPRSGDATGTGPQPVAGRAAEDAAAAGTGSHRVPRSADAGGTGSHRVPRSADAAGTGSQRPPRSGDVTGTGSHRVPARRGARRASRGRDRTAATAAIGAAATATPTGHGHGHGPPAPAARRVVVVISCLLVPAAIATLVGLVLLHPGARPQPAPGAAALPRVDAQVTATTPADCADAPGEGGCVALAVVPQEGPLAGRSITVLVSAPQPGRGAAASYAPGDPVVLVWTGDPADPASYDVSDFQRGVPLTALAVLFALAVVLLGRWQGFKALVALGLTGIVLVTFMLPAILAGRDPLWVAVVGSCAIMFGVLYLTHGLSARTSTAVLGTLGSLLLIGLLGALFAAAARLTGLDEDTANLGAALGAPVDGRGLVLAGLVIGALGALDDVTVTQTSAVWELRAADPGARPGTLFAAAMRIGRDHVASAVNTLVLAYAGAALPLLLLFAVAERGLGDALTSQVIGTEVVRTLVGSIGIVASVPLTTALAVLVSSGQGRPVRARVR